MPSQHATRDSLAGSFAGMLHDDKWIFFTERHRWILHRMILKFVTVRILRIINKNERTKLEYCEEPRIKINSASSVLNPHYGEREGRGALRGDGRAARRGARAPATRMKSRGSAGRGDAASSGVCACSCLGVRRIFLRLGPPRHDAALTGECVWAALQDRPPLLPRRRT